MNANVTRNPNPMSPVPGAITDVAIRQRVAYHDMLDAHLESMRRQKERDERRSLAIADAEPGIRSVVRTMISNGWDIIKSASGMERDNSPSFTPVLHILPDNATDKTTIGDYARSLGYNVVDNFDYVVIAFSIDATDRGNEHQDDATYAKRLAIFATRAPKARAA